MPSIWTMCSGCRVDGTRAPKFGGFMPSTLKPRQALFEPQDFWIGA